MIIQLQTLLLKNALSEKYHMSTPWYCISSLSVGTNEYTQRKWANMFNEVVWYVKAHAIHYNMDYTTLQILSRKQLVQLVRKYYQLNFLKPTLHSVPHTDESGVTVPIFNVKALLIAFLNDFLRMGQENFASNYIFTGKAKLPTSTLDEINTWSLWEQARQKYCGDDPDAFPLALVCFMTKQILMYLVHFHVRHSFVHHHSWTKTVAMMTQIIWFWVISPILDMEKEKRKKSWDEITGWTQLSFINNQSNY